MAFDGITVAALTRELKNTLDGGHQQDYSRNPDELQSRSRPHRDRSSLYISASASLPLVYLTDENKPSPL